ncbi:hypothetical protein IJG27_01230 [Candidatus Saccharibacteria bacterium]|nr:hypothetical protein [Candidatus Saccharibacteria bacterium]
MPQTKKKKSSKTAKRTTTATKTHKKVACRTNCKKSREVSNNERMHVYIVTALSITAAILLCADAAIIMNT